MPEPYVLVAVEVIIQRSGGHSWKALASGKTAQAERILITGRSARKFLFLVLVRNAMKYFRI